MAKHEWTDEEREVLISIRESMVRLIRDYYNAILDGDFEKANGIIQDVSNAMSSIGIDYYNTSLSEMADMSSSMLESLEENVDEDYEEDDEDGA